MKPFIVILSGPTCAGKSTLESMLRAGGFSAVVSTTSRLARAGEIHGKHYHFVTRGRFNAMREADSFVEATEFDGNLYGVTVNEILKLARAGKPIVVVVEPNGRRQIVDYCERKGWAYHTVYVGNPDAVIAERFLRRLAAELQGRDEDAVNEVFRRYAKRMESMMTIERAWVIEAYFQNVDTDSSMPYHQILWQFDQNSQTSAIAQIFERWRQHRLKGEQLAA